MVVTTEGVRADKMGGRKGGGLSVDRVVGARARATDTKVTEEEEREREKEERIE